MRYMESWVVGIDEPNIVVQYRGLGCESIPNAHSGVV